MFWRCCVAIHMAMILDIIYRLELFSNTTFGNCVCFSQRSMIKVISFWVRTVLPLHVVTETVWVSETLCLKTLKIIDNVKNNIYFVPPPPMEPEDLLPCSKMPATGPYPELGASYSFNIIFNIILLYSSLSLKRSVSLKLSTKILYAHLTYPTRATCPANYLIFDCVVLIIFN
jgi:hypothetical protein